MQRRFPGIWTERDYYTAGLLSWGPLLTKTKSQNSASFQESNSLLNSCWVSLVLWFLKGIVRGGGSHPMSSLGWRLTVWRWKKQDGILRILVLINSPLLHKQGTCYSKPKAPHPSVCGKLILIKKAKRVVSTIAVTQASVGLTFFFQIERLLLYNFVLVSTVQKSESNK